MKRSMAFTQFAKTPGDIVNRMVSWYLLVSLFLLTVGCDRSVPALQLVAIRTIESYPNNARLELHVGAGKVGFALVVPPDKQVSADVRDARIPSPEEYRDLLALAQGCDFRQQKEPVGSPKRRVVVTQEWSDGRSTAVQFSDTDPQYEFYGQWRRTVSNVIAGRQFGFTPPGGGTEFSFEFK